MWQVVKVVAVNEDFVINFYNQSLVVDDEVCVKCFPGNLRQLESVQHESTIVQNSDSIVVVNLFGARAHGRLLVPKYT